MVFRNRLVLDLDEDNGPELARENNVQLRLNADHCCRVNMDSLQGKLYPVSILLFEWGLLSFNPTNTYQLTDAEHAEVSFLSALAKSGCSRNDLKRILNSLLRPYAYHLHRMHYDWKTNRWQYMKDENPHQVFKEQLEDCINNGDGFTLKIMRIELEEAESRYIDQWGDIGN